MATSAYLSPGPPPLSEQEEGGVMNLVNPAVSQSYSVPREQVVRLPGTAPTPDLTTQQGKNPKAITNKSKAQLANSRREPVAGWRLSRILADRRPV
jgi:hypothetical protein